MTRQAKPAIEFIAESSGPPRRKFYIWHDPPNAEHRPQEPSDKTYGWGFQVTEFNAEGDEEPYWDTWEMTFEEVVRYPELYGPKDMIWRSGSTGGEIDIYSGLFP